MNLKKKKNLIARMLGIGTGRIFLDSSKAGEIKEAITRQDMRELINDGAIKINDKKGRKRNEKRKAKKLGGKIKKRRRQKKRGYVILTRKLRKHLLELKKKGKIQGEEYHSFRKRIKARAYRSIKHFREGLKS